MQVIVSGPTASGKTGLSLYLASELSGEVVNADSVQIYRNLDIGSAKPTRKERSKVPHHLFDILDPGQLFSAGDYVRAVTPILDDIAERGRTTFIAGGTTLYLSALLSGLADLPPADAELRDELETKESVALHALLQSVDPETANRLHVNDRLRVIRALEVFHLTGKKMSELHQKNLSAYSQGSIVLVLIPDRQKLYERINVRSEEMVRNGILEETERVLSEFGSEAPCLRSLGYAQCASYLAGEIGSESELIESIAQNTRKYAKRQMTFWRQEPSKRGWEVYPTDDEVGVLRGNEPSPHMPDQSTMGIKVYEYSPRQISLYVRRWLSDRKSTAVPTVLYLSAEALS